MLPSKLGMTGLNDSVVHPVSMWKFHCSGMAEWNKKQQQDVGLENSKATDPNRAWHMCWGMC